MNNDKPLKVKGALFQPLQARAQACVMILEADDMSLEGEDLNLPDQLNIESFQDRKHFHFTSGHYFVADEPLTAEQAENYLYLYDFSTTEKNEPRDKSSIQKTAAKTSRFLNSLENLNAVKIIILVGFFFACLVGFRFAWPHMSKPIVALIPLSVDKTIGENTYKSLRGVLFKDTSLPKEQIERLTKRAQEMAETANLIFRPKIYFHSSPLGANAMALPGGPIIVTDELVKLLKDDTLILAVIGHEYGHVEGRHSMHQIVHLAGITAVASLIFGADESILEELAGVAITSWAFKNRRAHEHDADIFSVQFFKQNNMDPSLMITVMEKLSDHLCSLKEKADKSKDKPDKKDSSDLAKKIEACKNAETGWFSTHPSGPERIKAMRDAISGRN